MIIDCHCHAGKGDGFRGPWDTEARIEPYLARAEAAGIDRTVVFPVFNSDYAAANARLARIVRRHAPRLIGFAAVNPVRDAKRVGAMVGRAVETYGFRGLKVHGLDAYPGRELCEAAHHVHEDRYPVPPRRRGGDAGQPVSRRQLHHPAPRRLRRRLDGAPAGG